MYFCRPLKFVKKVSAEVKHDGIVQSIDGDKIFVSIISKAACLSCKVNESCSTSEMSEKIIEVNRFEETFKIGDPVTVSLKETSGLKALMIGYMLPFAILLITLLTIMEYTGDELMAGLVSLAILVPYYFLLFVLREKLKKQFSFFVHKR